MPSGDGKTYKERFMQSFKIEASTGCWLWIKGITGHGYGGFYFEGREVPAHRAALFFFKNVPIAAGSTKLVADHLCRNRTCVNPEHLEMATQRENVRRGLNFGLKTHCKHGHLYEGSNVGINGKGHRYCKPCSRIRTDACIRKKKQLAGKQEADMAEGE